MIGKLTGREAVELTIEHNMGFHPEYTGEDLEYLECEVKAYYKKLRHFNGHQGALEILARQRETVTQLLETPVDEEFYFTQMRERDDMMSERDLIAANSVVDALERVEQEYLDDHAFWNKMGAVADSQKHRAPDCKWNRCREHLEEFEENLTPMEKKYEKQIRKEKLFIQLDPRKGKLTVVQKEYWTQLEKRIFKIFVDQIERDILRELSLTLRVLRFGGKETKLFWMPWYTKKSSVKGTRVHSLHDDGIYIAASMWKQYQNRINLLLGSSQQYHIKEKKVDALTEEQQKFPGIELIINVEKRDYTNMHGLDLENFSS